MTTTFFTILELNGFTALKNGSFVWGVGSLVGGYSVKVKPLAIENGTRKYKVNIHHWQYDADGELVIEEEKTKILFAGDALAFIFQEVPQQLWK